MRGLGLHSKHDQLFLTKFASTREQSRVLGISCEHIDVIPTNQDLYCIVERNGVVLKLPHSLLTNYVGDLLITQGGRAVPPAELFIAHWDGTQFVVRGIPVEYYSNGEIVIPDEIEGSIFGPINIPPIPQ